MNIEEIAERYRPGILFCPLSLPEKMVRSNGQLYMDQKGNLYAGGWKIFDNETEDWSITIIEL